MRTIEKAPQIRTNKKIGVAKENARIALNVLLRELQGAGWDSKADARKVELMLPKIKSIRQ